MSVTIGCGDSTCQARVVAWLMDPDDRGRVDPCPACVEAVHLALRHYEEDKARVLRSANNVIVGRW